MRVRMPWWLSAAIGLLCAGATIATWGIVPLTNSLINGLLALVNLACAWALYPGGQR